jgi:dTDP-4-amino-4,6-dideoxygalactose transaminase
MCKAAALMIFIHPRLYWVPNNLPFLKLGQTLFDPHFPILKMSSFQAGLARNWRARLETLRDARRKNVDGWIAALEASVGRVAFFPERQSPGLLRFPVRLRDTKNRACVLRESVRKGMGVTPVYPTAIDAIPELRGKIEGATFPVAERCASELVTLPTHGYLRQNDVRDISRLLAPALRKYAEVSDSAWSVEQR